MIKNISHPDIEMFQMDKKIVQWEKQYLVQIYLNIAFNEQKNSSNEPKNSSNEQKK